MISSCLDCLFCTGLYTACFQVKVARNHILVVQMLHKKFRVHYLTESQQNGLHKLILIYATITCFIFSCPVQCSFKFKKCTIGSSSGHQHSVKFSLPLLACFDLYNLFLFVYCLLKYLCCMTQQNFENHPVPFTNSIMLNYCSINDCPGNVN